jgi:ActR/RegA family two-component response regulator
MQKLLLVEDDPNLNFTIVTALEAQGYTVDAVTTTGEAIQRLGDNAYPVVLTDIYIDERTGLDVLDAAKRKDPLCAVILMTGRGTVETVMAATKGGAFEYIAKPFEWDTLFDALTRAEAARNDTEAEAEEEELPESVMIGSSAAMVEIYKSGACRPHRCHRVSRARPAPAGTGGAHDPPLQPARQAALCAGGLRRHRAVAAGKRTLRRHAWGIYRSRPRSHRRLRSRQPRYRLPG